MLSIYQHDGAKGRATLCSTYGTPSGNSLEALKRLAAKHPEAEFHLALEGDKAGQEFKVKVAAALQKGNPEARIVDRTPDPVFKGWTGQIGGVTKADTDAAKAAARAEAAAAIDAAQCRRVEEARRRAEEEARRAQAGGGLLTDLEAEPPSEVI